MSDLIIQQLAAALLSQQQALQCQPSNLAELNDYLPESLQDLIPASVLCALVMRETGLHVLLTKRAEHLRKHAGQVSFPGGRMELQDTDPFHTALREAREEIHLQSASIELIGCLAPMATITGFLVYPMVVLLDSAYTAKPDGNEVSELFEAPLSLFLDEKNEHAFEIEFQGAQRQLREFRFEQHRIWGATATMLINLRQRLEQKI